MNTPTQQTGGESATPRTDKLSKWEPHAMVDYVVPSTFARELERETATLHAQLGEARAERDMAQRELDAVSSKALGLFKENESLRGILVMLKRELDDHVTDPTKLELPKSAWQEAMNRINP